MAAPGRRVVVTHRVHPEVVAFNPAATREAVGRLAAPVLIYAGELDAAPSPGTAEAGACLFPNATVTVQPGASHFPWLDDPGFFAAALTSFLS
jgi:pimeloyl-ACP methyl ester carboxylesterase